MVFQKNITGLKSLIEIQQDCYTRLEHFSMFLFVVRSQFKKIIAYFIPTRYKKSAWIKSETQICFYFINKNNELVTAINETDPAFESNDWYLVWIADGLVIKNNKEEKDEAYLSSSIWSGTG